MYIHATWRRSLPWRRILPPKDIAEHRVNRQWLFVPDWLRADMDLGMDSNGETVKLFNPFPEPSCGGVLTEGREDSESVPSVPSIR
jgi:hypothetical protein